MNSVPHVVDVIYIRTKFFTPSSNSSSHISIKLPMMFYLFMALQPLWALAAFSVS
jgi:hypothetical protein